MFFLSDGVFNVHCQIATFPFIACVCGCIATACVGAAACSVKQTSALSVVLHPGHSRCFKLVTRESRY